jgi:hypothetical protein
VTYDELRVAFTNGVLFTQWLTRAPAALSDWGRARSARRVAAAVGGNAEAWLALYAQQRDGTSDPLAAYFAVT